MMLDLKRKIIDAISEPNERDISKELTTLVYRTPWVRILVDRSIESGSTIEVEMALPDSLEITESASLIDKLSEHLQYLQNLRNFGFELSVIGTGCIYCASCELDKTPEDNLFRALIPP
ncbi:MAG: hypothetical protein ACFFCP_03605 [Promethearchaeota archaeon]